MSSTDRLIDPNQPQVIET